MTGLRLQQVLCHRDISIPGVVVTASVDDSSVMSACRDETFGVQAKSVCSQLLPETATEVMRIDRRERGVSTPTDALSLGTFVG